MHLTQKEQLYNISTRKWDLFHPKNRRNRGMQSKKTEKTEGKACLP
jgi:hypothetical protein